MAQTMLREYLQKTEDAISAGHIDEAMSRCQYLLTYFPDALEVQRLLGEIYMAQGHLEDAQQVFDWILTNDPENVIVYCDRALMSERMSDIETALDCYQQAYELSRANPQIRQEFNQLSARSGQPGFMFSRAGLARLYMRGDLLVQAIQEWEAVLANTPNRLDARTGLLEAYWREGLYDQVEQLATQILDEIPGCVKALLLLAHVTAPQNFERAKTLVQQARLLDPEMHMASNLFSELAANHPRDPFLMLLKQEPIVLPEANGVPAPVVASPVASTIEANGSISPVPASDPSRNWHHMESWSELDTLSIPQQEMPAVQEPSSFATWSGNNIQHTDQWAPMNTTPSNRINGETWQEPQAFDEDFDPALLEQQPWYQAEQMQSSTPPEAASTWDHLSPGNHAEPVARDSWPSNIQETDLPTPPAWLDMLTRGERAHSGEPASSPPIQPDNSQEQEDHPFTTRQESEPDLATQASGQQYADTPIKQNEEPIFFSSDDKDDDISWPEWLKSLGAATLDEPPAEETIPVVPEPHGISLPEPWGAAPAPEPQHRLDEPAAPVDQTLAEEEKQYLITMENLERDLHRQGFIPLEPGMLSAIAPEPEQEEPSLSSALAQLANFTPSYQSDQANAPITASESEEAAQPFEFTEPVSEPAVANDLPQPVEPLWGTEVPAAVHEPAADAMVSPPPLQEWPAFHPVDQIEAQQEPQPPDETETASQPMSNAAQEQELQPAPEQVFAPAASANNASAEENVLIPAYRADSLLEDELETTMKRPAIRLQPVQKSGGHMDIPHPTLKARPGERGAGSKMPEGDLSNKERLLKGYQYQLAGAYDDAMQEYRIIIRNAPELLGEVVSNLRALLKLAPKYSAGYRVLGDAYMREGEYLQAMEAYNKALTMAKKAKSQSR
jgi:tetratricopeptide (TPR) repeat protein